MLNSASVRTLLCTVLALTLLQACAPKTTRHHDLDSTALWKTYCATESRSSSPYRIGLSARIGTKEDTRRITALLWGNTTDVIRLDAFAGVGAVIAKIYQDPTHFLLFAPMENRAYVHEGLEKPMLRLGMPLPLTLRNMTDLLRNESVRVFGHGHGATQESDRGVRYALVAPHRGTITLDPLGRVVEWEENGTAGWRMQIRYGEDSLPLRLELENARNERAILVVHSRETADPYTEAQMRFTLPKNCEILPLKKAATARK